MPLFKKEEMMLLDDQLLLLGALTTLLLMRKLARKRRRETSSTSDDSDLDSSQNRPTRKRKRRKERSPRSVWVKPWVGKRSELGAFDQLMVELANEDIPGYIGFQRMAPKVFNKLLNKVGPLIVRQKTALRHPISPGVRLAITLRYLATGKSLTYSVIL